jgi:pterin-4a-carbinolamine dehydratase
MEGTKQVENEKDEELLGQLERANLVKGETRFTHRNFYRQFQLTTKGAEIAKQLAYEPQSQLLSQPNL